MTNKNLVMTAIDFKTPRQLPIWDNYWGKFSDNWREYMNFDKTVCPEDYYGICISICVADESLFPSQKKIIKTEGEYEISNDGWGRIVRTGKNNIYFSETVDHILKNPSELTHFKPEPAALDLRFDGFAEKVNREKKAGRCVFAKIGGLYCRSQFVRGEENLLVDMALDENFCNDLFDVMLEHRIQMALETLHRGDLWDTGLFIYDDMANSKTVNFSPAMFENYFLPRYKRLINEVKKAGCRHVFFHSDGNILPVMEMLLEAGFTGFNPLEPSCGMELTGLRKQFGKRMVFFGGVCNKFILPRGNKKEIEAHVRPLIELGRDGGLILGQASIGDDINPEAYDYYISLIKEHGNYCN
ncbi:MAG: hypothetical protein A2096_17750 [Spirochaetes bacterium GWF1_41_5]|nr:MAG: hypothetical protein A2096_17750 [Spirochaetes bacterium GWF1_41_5]HBE03411.1 hypothetical protein [Spirochaetia bacterium]